MLTVSNDSLPNFSLVLKHTQ